MGPEKMESEKERRSSSKHQFSGGLTRGYFQGGYTPLEDIRSYRSKPSEEKNCPKDYGWSTYPP